MASERLLMRRVTFAALVHACGQEHHRTRALRLRHTAENESLSQRKPPSHRMGTASASRSVTRGRRRPSALPPQRACSREPRGHLVRLRPGRLPRRRRTRSMPERRELCAVDPADPHCHRTDTASASRSGTRGRGASAFHLAISHRSGLDGAHHLAGQLSIKLFDLLVQPIREITRRTAERRRLERAWMIVTERRQMDVGIGRRTKELSDHDRTRKAPTHHWIHALILARASGARVLFGRPHPR